MALLNLTLTLIASILMLMIILMILRILDQPRYKGNYYTRILRKILPPAIKFNQKNKRHGI